MWLLQLCYSHPKGVPGRIPGLNSTLFWFFPKRASTVSQVCWARVPSPVSVKEGTTCRQLPPEAKQESSGPHTTQSLLLSSQPSVKEERLDNRSLTSHTFKLSPSFPFFLPYPWVGNISSYLPCHLLSKSIIPWPSWHSVGEFWEQPAQAGFLFYTKRKERERLWSTSMFSVEIKYPSSGLGGRLFPGGWLKGKFVNISKQFSYLSNAN